mgnify:FL=1|tara:strand:- start:7720 stop:8115 length:396 start_codon:yes stop_codon:yes gene_type:complete
MGFLDKITKAFTGEDTLSEENGVWNIISTNEELEAILLASNERTQVVFKHSPSCGVSYFALRHLNDPQLFENNEIDLHLIDVINQRSLSMDFAMRVGVRHESPQIFVVKDGEVKWHASHNSVNAKNVLEHI